MYTAGDGHDHLYFAKKSAVSFCLCRIMYSKYAEINTFANQRNGCRITVVHCFPDITDLNYLDIFLHMYVFDFVSCAIICEL